MAEPRFWLAGAAGVLLVLLAAKVHGRQLRLQREAAGHFGIVFGGPLPPYVEALWRRDRIHFWLAAVSLGLALPAVAALLGASWWQAALLALVLAPSLAFSILGVRSLLALPPAARRGSVGWWIALLAALLAWMALLVAP